MRSTWTELFAEVRRVYGSVSALLLDADQAMDRQGYVSAHGKARQIGIERSGDIGQPDFWAPAWVARFYESRQTPPPRGPVLYVACVLSDGGGEDFQLPEGSEPVLTAGILYYGAKGETCDWFYWLAKCWFWHTKDRVPDGSWVERESADWHKWGIQRIESFAIPLLSIDSRAALEEKVILPLLSHVRQPGQKARDIFDLIADLSPGSRSKDDIDRQIAQERAAWG